MKLEILLAIGLLAATGLAKADIYTCDENGQTVFRDEPCLGQHKATPRIKSQRAEPVPQKLPATDPECRFSYFLYSGEKSKALAENAKEECLNNKALKKAGQASAMRLDAYRLWKDNRDMRVNAVNENQRRSEALMNRLEAPLKTYQPRTMNCTPNMMRDGLECR